MKLVGTMLVRNEDWVLGFALRAALQWLDAVVIYDDRSNDGTFDIVKQVSRELDDSTRLHYIDGRQVELSPHTWREMQQRQHMLNEARRMGATHVAIVDADEVLTANLLPTIRNQIASHTGARRGYALPMVSPYNSPDLTRRRVDGSHKSQGGMLIAFEDDPAHGWIAAGDGYQHHMRAPTNMHRITQCFDPPDGGGVFHLQFVTEKRLKVKSAWYKAMEIISYPGRMTAQQLNQKYDWTLNRGGEQYARIPSEWTEPYVADGILTPETYRPDDEAWQRQALVDMIDTHGIAPFAAINLHGVITADEINDATN